MAILPLQSDALRGAGNLHLSALAAVLVGATDEGLEELREVLAIQPIPGIASRGSVVWAPATGPTLQAVSGGPVRHFESLRATPVDRCSRR